MKILTVIGARPQFIKAATVSRAIAGTGIQEVVVHTGQHFDINMSEVFFQQMEIPNPHYHLDIHGLRHGAMTGRMLEKIEEIILKEKPDKVLVYGDTNSTLAGALAAAKLNYPVAHVEAGLRSFNMTMPEEINRILTDRVSQFLFCPTETAVSNLRHEGFDHFECRIEQSGDVMLDAVQFYSSKAKATSSIVEKMSLVKGEFFLATIHRAENTDDLIRLQSIFAALNEIHATIPVVLPLHPRTRRFLDDHKIVSSVNIIPPIGYFDMLMLLENCKMVLTDSGGLQKEAYFFNKFCVTLRDETEWTELVAAGVNELVGADKERIKKSVDKNMNKIFDVKALYGDGDAAGRIVRVIASL